MEARVGEKRLAEPNDAPAKKVQRALQLPSELSQRLEGVVYALEDGGTEVLWWRGSPVVVSGDRDCVCEHDRLGVECCRPPPPSDSYLKKTPVATSGPGTSGRTYRHGGWYRVVEGTDKNPLMTCIHGGRLLPCATCGEAEAMCVHEHVFARCTQCPPLALLTSEEEEEEEEDADCVLSEDFFAVMHTEEEEEEEEEEKEENDATHEETEKDQLVAMNDPAFDWDKDFCPERHRPIGLHPWWNAEDQRRIARDYECEAQKLPLISSESQYQGVRFLKNGFSFIYGETNARNVYGKICTHRCLLTGKCWKCMSYLRCTVHGMPRAFCRICAPRVCVHGFWYSKCPTCRRICDTTEVMRYKCDHCTAEEEALPMEIRRLPIQPYRTGCRVEGRLYRIPDRAAKHGWTVRKWFHYAV